MSDEAVCRTAPATPGLLITLHGNCPSTVARMAKKVPKVPFER